MRHYYLKDKPEEDSSHYAVNVNCNNDYVLIQLGDCMGNQVRLMFSKANAEDFVALIKENIDKLKA